MTLLIIATLASLIIVTAGGNASTFETYFGSFNAGIYLLGIANIAGLACGIIYLLKDYSKDAAIYYKAFLAFVTITCILNMYACYIYRKDNVAVAILFIKILILISMIIWDNLGEKVTWMLLAIIVAIDLYMAFTGNNSEDTIYKIIFILSKLVADGTIA